MNYNKIHKIIRYSLIAVACIAFIFLLNKKIVHWGNFKVEYNFSTKFHPFISSLRPEERLGEKSDGKDGFFYYSIKGEPVYFDIETPRDFNKVNLELEYNVPAFNKNFFDFKIGILLDKASWNYHLEPIENRKIEQLANDWDNIREGETVLLQGIKKYSSITDFLNNLAPFNQIAVYNYDLSKNYDYVISEYEKNSEYREIEIPLKGRHQFYTYIDNEPLDIIFTFSSLKEDDILDNAAINIYYRNGLLERREIFNHNKNSNKVRIFKDNLQKAVYKIEIAIPDNINIEGIETKQKFLAFINKIHLAQSEENYSKIFLYTSAPSLKIAADKGDSLQNIKIAGKTFKINELYKEFNFNKFSCEDYRYSGLNYCLTEIQLEKDNILVQGAGIFSFSQEEFLDPEIKSLDKMEDFSKINYVIANYKSSEELEDGWKKNNVSFDISSVKRDKSKYNFILSVSGIKQDEPIYIRKIKAVFE